MRESLIEIALIFVIIFVSQNSLARRVSDCSRTSCPAQGQDYSAKLSAYDDLCSRNGGHTEEVSLGGLICSDPALTLPNCPATQQVQNTKMTCVDDGQNSACTTLQSDYKSELKDLKDTSDQKSAAKDADDAKKNITSVQKQVAKEQRDLRKAVTDLDQAQKDALTAAKAADAAQKIKDQQEVDKINAQMSSDRAQLAVLASGVKVAQAAMASIATLNSSQAIRLKCIALVRAQKTKSNGVGGLGAATNTETDALNAFNSCVDEKSTAATEKLAEAQGKIDAAMAQYNSLNDSIQAGKKQLDAATAAATTNNQLSAEDKLNKAQAYAQKRQDAMTEYTDSLKSGATEIQDAQQAYKTATTAVYDTSKNQVANQNMNDTLARFKANCCSPDDDPLCKQADLAASRSKNGSGLVSLVQCLSQIKTGGAMNCAASSLSSGSSTSSGGQ
jgi:chromosome segregation ATPase